MNTLTDNKVDQEHVVNFILKNPRLFKIYEFPLPRYLKNNYYRLTMDYLEDFLLIKKFIVIYQNIKNTLTHLIFTNS